MAKKDKTESTEVVEVVEEVENGGRARSYGKLGIVTVNAQGLYEMVLPGPFKDVGEARKVLKEYVTEKMNSGNAVDKALVEGASFQLVRVVGDPIVITVQQVVEVVLG